MDGTRVDMSAAEASMNRAVVTREQVLQGIARPFGRIDDPFVDGAFVLSAQVDDGLPIEIHCISTMLEEMLCVLNVGRDRPKTVSE